MRNRLKSLLALNFSLKRRRKKNVFANVFFTCQPISRVPWNDDGLYDDQHQNRGENTDEKEVFMTVTEKGSTLTIRSAKKEDSGQYMCQVPNGQLDPQKLIHTVSNHGLDEEDRK